VRHHRLLLFALLLLTCSHAMALEITSIAPNRGTPGTLVLITGGPFSAQTQPFLGQQYVPPRQVLQNQLEISVPYLPPGTYNLTVQDAEETALQTVNFEVMAPQPQIEAISPSNLDFCTDEPERWVRVEGRNFLPASVLLLNGNAVQSRHLSSESLEFQLPTMPAGVYGVEVRNPDGVTSLPHSFWVDSVPEILSIEQGEDFVNHYEMIIRGKNFFYNSILVVKEPEESTIGQAYRQLSFHASGGGGGLSQLVLAPQAERLIYVDCQTLIYQRYPSNFQSKGLLLQVINPDGNKTDPYSVSLP